MVKLAGINTFNNFSTGTAMVNSLKYAEERGFDCRSFYGRCRNQSNNSIFFGEPKIINKIIDFNVALCGSPGHGHKSSTRKLIELLDDFQPDLIHFQNLHGNYLDFPLLLHYVITHHIPTVATLHDCWYFTGRCAHYPLNCQHWKTGCGNCPDIHRYMRSLLFDKSESLLEEKRRLFSQAQTTFIAPSTWMLKQFKDSLLSSNPVLLINNGIDLAPFNASVPNRHQKICLLGVAHPWSNEKGLDVFNRLADALDPNFYQIVLVGCDPLHSKTINPKIKQIGVVSSKRELASLYASSDLFVNPTKFDTFPTTNIEAMASGVPIFAFDSGGAAEVIKAATGLAFPSGDFEGLLNAIKVFKRGSYNREEIIAESQKYSELTQFDRYFSLYNKLVKKT